jgi:hypothetical protein
MAGVGSLVLASDYNGVQQKISNVLGTGAPLGGPSNGHGYGITPASGTVAGYDVITAAQWNDLLSDVNKAYTHQNGRSFPGYQLVAKGDLITYSNLAKVSDYIDGCLIDYLKRAPNQTSVGQFVDAQDVRNKTWGFGDSSVDSEYTISFSSAQDMNYYFNQGGTFSLVGIAAMREYRVQADKTSVDEGSTVTFSLTAQGVPDGTSVAWTVTGVSSNDLSDASLTGSFVVGQTQTVTFTALANKKPDNDRTIQFSLDSGVSSATCKINDTSRVLNKVTKLYSQDSSSVISRNADLSTTNGSGLTWVVVCFRYGAGDGTGTPGAPTVGGTALTKRAEVATNYKDDGSRTVIWASPVTNTGTAVPFSFSPYGGGYSNSVTAVYKVEGVPSSAAVGTTTKTGFFVGTFTVTGLPTYGCTFVAGTSAKSGGKSVFGAPTDDALAAPGIGGVPLNQTTSLTFSAPDKQSVAVLWLPFTT